MLFFPNSVVTRIKAHTLKKNPLIQYGNMKYDLLAKRIYWDEKEVDLGYVDKEILDILVRNMSQTIEKDIFFDVMQKPTELALRVHIAKLKKRFKLEITNVKAIGYRLEKV